MLRTIKKLMAEGMGEAEIAAVMGVSPEWLEAVIQTDGFRLV